MRNVISKEDEARSGPTRERRELTGIGKAIGRTLTTVRSFVLRHPKRSPLRSRRRDYVPPPTGFVLCDIAGFSTLSGLFASAVIAHPLGGRQGW